jgi:predicted thioesterase
LTFQVEAWDEVKKIDEASDERFEIHKKKFIAKAKAKME